ncbi:2Fe-2S iron-sulfur cluster-binding protein [Roseateles toxinivorans]|uniref:Ferredoxin n=1 Tax=Roseateles toxinivorans TaxID=270368 RepID=A0A4V3CST0_9BURK|nr:2Fe-2S iron-sulfur cluster binding domain-containing protein [Roseateles toxinivorans]TDP61848.1 ferredoxin [Roseateles toxinivorans]
MNNTPLVLHLAHSRRSIEVAATQSLLDALLEAGIDVPHSCRMGICGTCETVVLDGVPDHRDQLLSADERAAGLTMMLCCSRASTPSLTLDL